MAAANKFTTCQYIIEHCPFGSPGLANTCVQNFCLGEPYGFGSCGDDITGTPANCCSEDDPASCIAAFQTAQGYADADDACLQIEYELVSCSDAIQGFSSETLKQQADCLCYDDTGNFIPDVWDNNAASCVATGASTHPTVYAELMAHNGAAVSLCAGVSGGAAASSTPAAAATSPSATASSTPAAASDTPAASSTPPAASETPAATTAAASTKASTTSAVTAGSETTVTPVTVSSTTSSTVTTSSSAKAGAAGSRMGYLNMKLVVAGLGLFLPGLVLGTL